jgi:ATP-dependent HslUV protease ATP-binding subunit HslU
MLSVEDKTKYLRNVSSLAELPDDALAELAADINSTVENIGARRLHTVMERILEDISFHADEHKGETIVIDAEMIDKKLEDLVENEDATRYIL